MASRVKPSLVPIATRRVNKVMLAQLQQLFLAFQNSAESRAWNAALAVAASSLGFTPEQGPFNLNLETGVLNPISNHVLAAPSNGTEPPSEEVS